MSRCILYPGSFHPFHVGHEHIVREIRRSFVGSEVHVVKCINRSKVEEPDDVHNDGYIDVCFDEGVIRCSVWGGSFIDYVYRVGAEYDEVVIVRGIRGGVDLSYEESYIRHCVDMYKMKYNMKFPPVVYIGSTHEYNHISSSSIRAILKVDEDYWNSLVSVFNNYF